MTFVGNEPVGQEPRSASRRTPPGPRGNALFGKLNDIRRDRLALMTSVTREYGDAVRFTMGPKALYFFNHPDHAKHVLSDNHANYRKGIGLIQAKRALGDGLLTSEGELWRTQRRAIQPVFQRERMTRAATVVAEEAEALVTRWRAREPGTTVDVVGEMTHLTLGVLGRALLDADLGGAESIGEAFETVQRQAMFEMLTLGAVPPWLPLPNQLAFRRGRRELEDLVDRLVDEHQRDGGDSDGLLSRLIASTEQESDPKVRRRRIRDELITLMLAGHETTASTLGWTWYLVDRHPEVFDRLHAEAVQVLGDRRPTYQDLHELRFTNQVVEEAMRLYPPVWLLPRRAVADDEIGGYHVPAGADVMLCPYTLHRHPGFWSDPDRFDPDRFAPERAGERSRYAYIPFGAGPRFCVGNNLGMIEAVFVVATVARELRPRLVPGHQVVADPMLSLRLRGGLPMTLEPA
ncbi:cytochrome P450 [Micromonospora sp. SL1-18]|uniref:cytochrome P450 n=1 Tax=Micromonospora sp. SL1-18 TaxID=3399128 RepID=UPI003A4E571C